MVGLTVAQGCLEELDHETGCLIIPSVPEYRNSAHVSVSWQPENFRSHLEIVNEHCYQLVSDYPGAEIRITNRGGCSISVKGHHHAFIQPPGTTVVYQFNAGAKDEDYWWSCYRE